MTELREKIAEVVQDYADGLLDGREDAVEAILEVMREPTREMVLRSWAPDVRDKDGKVIDAVWVWRAMIDVALGTDRDPKDSLSGEMMNPPPKMNLGHSISTNPPK